jgi:hypothetical protein
VKELLGKKSPQTMDLPFGKKTTKFQGKIGLATNPLTPGKILSGEEAVKAGTFKNASGDLSMRLGKDKPLTLNTKNQYTFPAEEISGVKTGPVFKGSTDVGFENKAAQKSFTGKLDYETKPDILKLNASQKLGDKKGSINFTEGFAKDQNGTRATFGATVKSKIFTERLDLNLPRNPAGSPTGETAKMGLGIQLPSNATEKSKTWSADADITMNLAGEHYVQALSSFLEFKDPKDFLNLRIGYQRERAGQVNKEDFALALKKTWDEVSFYLGASFGMKDGKSARGGAVAGVEAMLRGGSKYGLFVEGEYNRSFLSGGGATLTTTMGLIRDKARFGAYITNDPANVFGLKYSQTFDPSSWLKKKR